MVPGGRSALVAATMCAENQRCASVMLCHAVEAKSLAGRCKKTALPVLADRGGIKDIITQLAR